MRPLATAVSLLVWIAVGCVVGYVAARTRPDWDARRPRGFIVAAIVGAVGGGLLAVAAGLGSLSTLLTPSTWLAALAFAVLSVTIYQSA